MPEIIDILSLPFNQSPYFTVDTSADFVATKEAPGITLELEAGSGTKLFRRGDSFSLISFGVVLPENFTFWKENNTLITISALPRFHLEIKTPIDGKLFLPDVFGLNDYLNGIMENYETVADVFVDVPKQRALIDGKPLVDDFVLRGDIYPTNISMCNVPSSLNGKQFYISPFFKILHNFPLSFIEMEDLPPNNRT